MRKKGAGNIEFILSFVLFIGFTIMALYFFNPIRGIQNLDSSGEYAINVIVGNSSVELDAYSIVVYPGNENKVRVKLDGMSPGTNVRVIDYYGSEVESVRDDGQICFTRDKGLDFFMIYLSEEIEGSQGQCGGSVNYKIASSSKNKIISEKRISQLKELYDADYSSLKTQLNIPSNVDFSFSIELANGDAITTERNILPGREVFSKRMIKEILNRKGASEFGYLTVKVW